MFFVKVAEKQNGKLTKVPMPLVSSTFGSCFFPLYTLDFFPPLHSGLFPPYISQM